METASFLSHSVPVVAVLILASYALSQRKGAVPSSTITIASVTRFIAAFVGIIVMLFTIRLVLRVPRDTTPPPAVPATGAPQTPIIANPNTRNLNIQFMNDSWLTANSIVPADFSCFASNGTALTCTPSYCANYKPVKDAPSEVDCPYDDSKRTQTRASQRQQTGGQSCRVCTQSKKDICSTANLLAMFGSRSTMIAAYCNDISLVLVASAEPTYTHNLNEIPYPPTGDTVPTCHTRESSVFLNGALVNTFVLDPTPFASSSITNNVNTASFPGGGTNCMVEANSAACYMGPNLIGNAYGFNTAGAIGATVDGQALYREFIL